MKLTNNNFKTYKPILEKLTKINFNDFSLLFPLTYEEHNVDEFGIEIKSTLPNRTAYSTSLICGITISSNTSKILLENTELLKLNESISKDYNNHVHNIEEENALKISYVPSSAIMQLNLYELLKITKNDLTDDEIKKVSELECELVSNKNLITLTTEISL